MMYRPSSETAWKFNESTGTMAKPGWRTSLVAILLLSAAAACGPQRGGTTTHSDDVGQDLLDDHESLSADLDKEDHTSLSDEGGRMADQQEDVVADAAHPPDTADFGDASLGDLLGDVPEVICLPSCTGTECGPDGCGGECGVCLGAQELCVLGTCECQPECGGKGCGPDGCGGECGLCLGAQELCVLGTCECQPECGGKECGPDGCGGECGVCLGAQELCVLGTCECQPDCADIQCGPDGCGGECGECPFPELCNETKCTIEILIPAGTFWMGCNEAVDTQCEPLESPYHEVYLDAYYIDRTEVTVDAYGECVAAGVCQIPGPQGGFDEYCNWGEPEKGLHPMNCLDWSAAETYCAWAGKRLPTEAEWEKAARGTDGRIYPWGNTAASCDYAVMGVGLLHSVGGCGIDSTWPVCSKSPLGDSPYGLCDMAGNLWEVTSDWWIEEYQSGPTVYNPTGASEGTMRVMRGCFFKCVDHLRTSVRHPLYLEPEYLGPYFLGFRCARSADQ